MLREVNTIGSKISDLEVTATVVDMKAILENIREQVQNIEMIGSLFIVSAPSGAGKTTLCNKAVEHFATLEHSVSYTTREPREGEGGRRSI